MRIDTGCNLAGHFLFDTPLIYVNNLLMPNKKHTQHKLAFIGAGYVGLVSGTCLADIGHKVILVDRKEETVKKLKKGQVPIFEPGLNSPEDSPETE